MLQQVRYVVLVNPRRPEPRGERPSQVVEGEVVQPRLAHGTSEIVNPDGTVLRAARQLLPELIVADIKPAPRERRRGWDAPRNGAVMEEYLRLLTGARV